MFTNHFEAQAITDVEGFLAVQPHHRSVAQVVGIGMTGVMNGIKSNSAVDDTVSRDNWVYP